MFKKYQEDRKRNKFYLFPEYDDKFKEEAYKDGKVFVAVIHPDMHIEYIERNVGKLWETSVYWNINSMDSKYKREGNQHLSLYYDLKVYACPIRYKEQVMAFLAK